MQEAVKDRDIQISVLKQELDWLREDFTLLETYYEKECQLNKEAKLQFPAKESKQEDEAIDRKNKTIETLKKRLDNMEEQYRSQTQEMNQKEKVINCNNETIKNLQQKLKKTLRKNLYLRHKK